MYECALLSGEQKSKFQLRNMCNLNIFKRIYKKKHLIDILRYYITGDWFVINVGGGARRGINTVGSHFIYKDISIYRRYFWYVWLSFSLVFSTYQAPMIISLISIMLFYQLVPFMILPDVFLSNILLIAAITFLGICPKLKCFPTCKIWPLSKDIAKTTSYFL